MPGCSAQTIAKDLEFQEGVITSVGKVYRYKQDYDSVEINFTCAEKDGYESKLSGAIPVIDGVMPKKGDIVRHCGKGFGYSFRGIALNGKILWYKTEKQQAHDHRRQVQKSKNARKKKFYVPTTLNRFNARVEALPHFLRLRMLGFIQRNPDFWEYADYELFCCEQAAIIADHFKTPEAIKEWKELPYETKKEVFPGVSEGHSGNTFDVSCGLAQVYLTEPEKFPRVHGAMDILVGCKDYGCWAASQGQEKEAS